MSRVITSRQTALGARCCAAITPAAGPDSTMWIGRWLAVLRRHDAAVGLHHEHRRVHADRRQACAPGSQVAADHRLHIRVDDGRAGAFVLADLGQDLRGERDRKLRGQTRHDLAHAHFVNRIRITVQQADRERFDAFGKQRWIASATDASSSGSTTLPSRSRRSVTSSRRRRGTSGGAWTRSGRTVVDSACGQSPACRESRAW